MDRHRPGSDSRLCSTWLAPAGSDEPEARAWGRHRYTAHQMRRSEVRSSAQHCLAVPSHRSRPGAHPGKCSRISVQPELLSLESQAGTAQLCGEQPALPRALGRSTVMVSWHSSGPRGYLCSCNAGLGAQMVPPGRAPMLCYPPSRPQVWSPGREGPGTAQVPWP